ncbi:FAD-dependent oxidoreductase [Companilactobacillus kimchiensis]|uniref:NADH oxidase n=1 Tax=Companilactobacillus kimchiensis TaxID=993692 RepID=A0A0R2L8Y1_9LACO|nr:FAD-dependent oxidoreductase [Companilactobacillus kimchiensis]KRN97905.1 NADH oxidase [Companilactobacillus kimchiensis]
MKVIVVGCTHAGTAAVEKILEKHPETDVTVYEREDNISFLSCGIALYLGRIVNNLEDMFYADPTTLEGYGAKVRMKHNVLKIDTKNKKIVVQDLVTQDITEDTYDKLIMTTGSEVGIPPIGGMDNPRVLLCKSYAQAKKIYESALNYPSIAIVGAGYVGVELAESYANTVHDVTLIQSRDQILNNYVDDGLSEKIIEKLKEHDVKVQLGERVSEIQDGDQLTITTKSGHAYKADLVIVCTGFFANTDLLRGQVQMDGYGAIIINDYMQTSDPDVYAGGDSCVVKFNPTGELKYIPLATTAVRQGTLAGINIFGDIRKYMGTQATTAMEIFGYTLAETGLTLKKALANGINADCVVYHDNYRPAYMPTTDMLTIYLVYDKDTRKVLGAQLFSKHEVAQSANAISICIQNNNTIDDLAFVDMLFQPNYDNPFNYLNLVAQQAIAKEDNK